MDFVTEAVERRFGLKCVEVRARQERGGHDEIKNVKSSQDEIWYENFRSYERPPPVVEEIRKVAVVGEEAP